LWGSGDFRGELISLEELSEEDDERVEKVRRGIWVAAKIEKWGGVNPGKPLLERRRPIRRSEKRGNFKGPEKA